MASSTNMYITMKGEVLSVLIIDLRPETFVPWQSVLGQSLLHLTGPRLFRSISCVNILK
jgi:hypothetical protein